MTSPVRLLLRVRVPPQHRELFHEFLRNAIPEYEEPGDIRMALLRNREDPDEYIEVVEYASREAFDEDQIRMETNGRMQELLKSWRTYLLGPPVVETFEIETSLAAPAPAGLPVLTTDRLVLRAFRMEDAARVAELANDRRIAETTLLLPHPYAPSDATAWFRMHYTQIRDDRGPTYAITMRTPTGEGELIGAIGLMIDRTHHRAELGYWIGVPSWNQGYATEAAAALVNHGFTSLALERIFAAHYAANPASGKIMQKLGMRHEGTLRRHIFRMGAWHDSVYYGILRDEYFSAQRAAFLAKNPGA
jgi:[ribosomal protein S5]-alanine N-acetyltransferase